MKRHRIARAKRRGLAPVELVLAIPLLLFVLALSVIFGAVTCWKVRAGWVARDAIFARRWPRGGMQDPSPPEWRVPNTYQPHSAGPPLASLDHAAFHEPVIRGPLPNNLVVNDRLFDSTLGHRIGHAELDRAPPMLATLGDYHLEVEHPLLDGKWQYGQMGIGSNRNRRIPVIYPNLLNPSQTTALRAQYQQAIQAVVGAPFRPDLAVLDRDAEIYDWYGHYHDFHPRFPRFCGLDPQPVWDDYLPDHIERIDGTPPPGQNPRRPFGVPADLTRFFLQMYRQQLFVLQNSVPPGPPGKIAELQQKIEILEDYLAYLSTI